MDADLLLTDDELALLTDDELEQYQAILEAELADDGRSWREIAREEQIAPLGPWFVWLILAGRGWGKTRTGAEWAAEMMRTFPGCRVALVAATFADGRDTMVEGESGLLAVLAPHELRGGTVDSAWNRSLGELFLANGSRVKVFSSEKPRSLRGPQHHFAWADEPAHWKDADKGRAKDTTWSNMVFGLRLKPGKDWPGGYRSRIVATTTPTQVLLLKARRRDDPPGLLDDELVHVTRGRTSDNLANLADEYRRNVIDPLVGTRLGRQELDAELLEDVEGALWSLDMIDADRWRRPVPELQQVVVSVDTSVSDTGDECGLIAVGKDDQAEVYVLEDRSLRAGPEERAETACLLAHDWAAGGFVVEQNQGGDLIAASLRSAWAHLLREGRVDGPMPRVLPVSARGSKADRAATAVQVYEQHRVHHLPGLAQLEDEQTTWTPDSSWSPNRLDALVHGVRHLVGAARNTRARQPARVHR